MITTAREISLSISGGDVLATFLLAPLVLLFMKFSAYIVLAVTFGESSIRPIHCLVCVVVITAFVALGFGVWEFSHWIVRE